MASEKSSGEHSGFRASSPGPKKNQSYKWASLVLVFFFLGGGGFVAWFLMTNAAHKLAGGAKYVRLSGTPASYGSGAQADQEQGFFASEEELAKADPSLKMALLDNSAAAGRAGRGATRTSASAGGGSGASGAASDEDAGGGSAGSGQGAADRGSALEDRLGARQGTAGRAKGAPPSRAGGLDPVRGTSVVAVASAQGETDKTARGLGKGPKTSILEALKSAFKVNLYGARLSSQDSAREWIAKTFDGNQDARSSLEYTSEKMKAQLDRVNPDSIPHYLRDQSLDAASARSLGSSEVDKPDFDKDGTKDALKGDKKYQAEKDGQDLAKKLFNPLGPFGGGSGSGSGPGENPADPGNTGLNLASTDGGAGLYDNPEDAQTLNGIALDDFTATKGNGEECGCTKQAPCCCLPPNALNQQCPLYGPFLPNDPCGAGINGPVGDFPPLAADGAMPV